MKSLNLASLALILVCSLAHAAVDTAKGTVVADLAYRLADAGIFDKQDSQIRPCLELVMSGTLSKACVHRLGTQSLKVEQVLCKTWAPFVGKHSCKISLNSGEKFEIKGPKAEAIASELGVTHPAFDAATGTYSEISGALAFTINFADLGDSTGAGADLVYEVVNQDNQ